MAMDIVISARLGRPQSARTEASVVDYIVLSPSRPQGLLGVRKVPPFFHSRHLYVMLFAYIDECNAERSTKTSLLGDLSELPRRRFQAQRRR